MFFVNFTKFLLWCIIGIGLVAVLPCTCRSRSFNSSVSSRSGRRSHRIAGGVSITNASDLSAKYGFFVKTEAYEAMGRLFGKPMRDCGGIIMNERQVLVSAACADGASTFKVIPNILDPGNSEKFLAKKLCTSEKHQTIHNFEGDAERYDITVLQLPDPIDFEKSLPVAHRSACLGEQELKIGDLGTIVGLGENEYGKREGKPKEVLMKVVDCPPSHRSTSTMCVQAADPAKSGGVCASDRGGPFVGVDGCVYGMASYSQRCEIGKPYIAALVDLTKVRRHLLDLMSDCLHD